MAPVDTNAAQELQQSLATYEEELNDLKGTSKPEITSLSEIAAEIAADHGEHGASSVCAAIERRIRKVRVLRGIFFAQRECWSLCASINCWLRMGTPIVLVFPYTSNTVA